MPFYEILVASPQHVQWVRRTGKFSLQKLGARPVDFSDPPGRLDRTWRNDDNPHIPWFGRNIYGFPITFKLTELRGKLDAEYRTIICTPSNIWLLDA